MRRIYLLSTIVVLFTNITTAQDCVTPAPKGDTIQKPCTLFGAPTIGDLKVEGENLIWSSLPGAGLLLGSHVVLENGKTYYVRHFNGDCSSAASLGITAIVEYGEPSPPPPIGKAFCSGDNPTIADLGDIPWYETKEYVNQLPIDTPLKKEATYYSNSKELCIKDVKQYVVVVDTEDAPQGETAQYICGDATISDLNVTGSDIIWYDQESNGEEIPTSTKLVVGKTYYATMPVEPDHNDIKLTCKRLPITIKEDCLSVKQTNLIHAIQISPNPIQSILKVKTPLEIKSLKVYAMNGQLVSETNGAEVNCQGLFSGIYVLVIQTNDNQLIHKFVKE